jgi:16S rRNA (guanine(527)-N(7))-methyltransferase RsmG
VRERLINTILENQAAFGLELERPVCERLADYYDAVMECNELLHLVAPTSPEQFATRHLLESLTLLKHLPKGVRFADVGSGGGLPAIPCLIAREDLRARLIESKEKKAGFLKGAIDRLDLAERAEVIGKQFAETDPGDVEFVTCRALDKFPEHLRRLIKWSLGRSLLFFGGEQIRLGLQEQNLEAIPELMPLSERRYLFAARR